jgi:hypothetical protein
MAKRTSSKPSWTDLKAKLASFDRPGLLGLIQDLYDANKDNQLFLHSRFGLGTDVLKPYKETLERWLSPDVFKNQDTSVVKAKQAISNYKKAVGDPAGLAELMVYYCECAAGFYREFGNDNESEFNALVNMFGQALQTIDQIPDSDRPALLARLDEVCTTSHKFGYGVGDCMDDMLAQIPEE